MPHTSGQFQKKVTEHGLKPLERRHLRDGIYLYLAEGVREATPDFPEPHWEMLWAAGFDDQLQVAQLISYPYWSKLPGTDITFALYQEDRIADVERVALEFIEQANAVELWNA